MNKKFIYIGKYILLKIISYFIYFDFEIKYINKKIYLRILFFILKLIYYLLCPLNILKNK